MELIVTMCTPALHSYVQPHFAKRNQPAIAECLGHVPACDTARAFEISEGAGDPQDAVVASRRKPQPFGSPQQQGPAGGLRACNLIE